MRPTVFYRTFVVCPAVFGTSLALATSTPPQQVQTVNTFYYSTLAGYQLDQTFRMANNGTSDIHRLTARYVADGENSRPEVAVYFDRDYFDGVGHGRVVRLNDDNTQNHAAAMCGNYGGYVGGHLDSSTYPDVPTWWLNTGSANKIRRGSTNDTGLFWDVNKDGDFVGYYKDGSDIWSAVCYDGVNGNTLFGPSGLYLGFEAKGVSNRRTENGSSNVKDMVGRGWTDSGDVPALWRYDGANWSFTDVSTVTGWPTGRNGFFVGITDKVSGDSNSPYAVGYIEDDGVNGGQPFIYAVGSGTFKLLGTEYGAPLQVSNAPYDDTSDPVVSFVGTSAGQPYVWVGSPDPNATYNGTGVDVNAFLDPDTPTSSEAATATGVDRDFVFGGSNYGGADERKPWMTNDSDWYHFSASSYSATVTTGSVVGGSTNDLLYADGKWAKVQRGTGLPQIVLTVEEVSNGMPPSGLAVRVTARIEQNYAVDMKLYLYNAYTSSWEGPLSTTRLAQTMKTAFGVAQDANLLHYADGNGHVKAKVTVTSVGLLGLWDVDFEQAELIGANHH